MGSIPEPDQTAAGPSYEGRLLDRADEEVVDQGVAFDIKTLVSRRAVLSIFGLGVGSAALAARTPSTTTGGSTATAGTAAGEIPDETADPYPGDGSNGPDILEQSGIVRSNIRSSIGSGATATGVPMALTLTILDMANNDAPFKDVAVYVWRCDSAGNYSMYCPGSRTKRTFAGCR